MSDFFTENQDSFDTHGFVGPLAWDIFYLFGADATWAQLPTPLVASGKDIIATTDELTSGLASMGTERGE